MNEYLIWNCSPADFSLCSCACSAMFLSIELPCFPIFSIVRCIRIRIWPRATTATTITTLTKKNTRTGFLENLVIVREIAYKRRRFAVPQASPSPLGRCSNRTQSDLPCRRVSYWTRLEPSSPPTHTPRPPFGIRGSQTAERRFLIVRELAQKYYCTPAASEQEAQ